MSNESTANPQFSRRFRRGMASAVFSAGAMVGVAGHAVVSNANEYNARPGCEFEATTYGVNSPQAATNKLTKAGGDVEDADMSIVAKDGHQRRRDTDPVDHRGDIVVQPGDKLDITHVDPNVCIAAGGVVINNEIKAHVQSDKAIDGVKSASEQQQAGQ